MSYALRDTRMILADDLELDYDSMNSLYAVGGEGAVLEYIAGLVEDYVEAHRGSLKILDFRRLESFDSAIDPKKEYRIALRIGCKIWDGEEIDLGGKGNFDYHFRAQLSDGQWAQKFPADISEVIPCSGPGLSPGKYPWNSALQWMPKFQNYYTGDVVYYAVTKDTDDFTRHKSAEETQ
jgi:hypothetical protein